MTRIIGYHLSASQWLSTKVLTSHLPLCRWVANKIALAVRMDVAGAREGTQGAALRRALQEKIEKLDTPSEGSHQRPLPRPGDGQRKKRGGRRMRRMKAAQQSSEIQRAMNHRRFGEASKDYYAEVTGDDLGMLGEQNGLNGLALRKQKTKMCEWHSVTIRKNVNALPSPFYSASSPSLTVSAPYLPNSEEDDEKAGERVGHEELLRLPVELRHLQRARHPPRGHIPPADAAGRQVLLQVLGLHVGRAQEVIRGSCLPGCVINSPFLSNIGFVLCFRV